MGDMRVDWTQQLVEQVEAHANSTSQVPDSQPSLPAEAGAMGTDRDDGMSNCPDCGALLRHAIPGFRPLTATERRQLTPHKVRVLGLCPNPACS